MSNGSMKVNNGRFEGEIRTMRIFLRFFLERNAAANSDKSPTHIIMAKAPAGHLFQAGIAWERTMRRGHNVGQSMFSLMLDDPEFSDKPVNFSAFPDNQGGYKITLERKRDNDQPASPKEDTAAVGGDVPFDAPAAAVA